MDTLRLMHLLAQIPEPKEGQDAWQWVAVAILSLAVVAVSYLFRDNAKLRDKAYDDAERRGADWKLRSETCSTDFGKTADALKVANDATIIVVGKVDKLAAVQDTLSEKIDRNLEQLRSCATQMERLQMVLERPNARSARDAT